MSSSPRPAVRLGALSQHIQHNDPFSLWLDCKKLHPPSDAHRARLAAYATAPRTEDALRGIDATCLVDESDACYLADKTDELIARNAAVILNATVRYGRVVADIPALLRSDVAKSLFPAMQHTSQYVAFSAGRACAKRDPMWDVVSHIASSLGEQDGSVNIDKDRDRVDGHNSYTVSGVRWFPVKQQAALHSPGESAASTLAAAVEWYARVQQDVTSPTPSLEPFSVLEMCPLLTGSLSVSPERAAYVRSLLCAARDVTLVYRCGRRLRSELWALGGRTYDDALRLHNEGVLELPRCAPEIIAANAPPGGSALSQPLPTTAIFGDVAEGAAQTLGRSIVDADVWVATDFETLQDDDGTFWIFMIASLAHGKDGAVRSQVHTMAALDEAEQRRVLREWFEWLEACSGKGGGALPTVVHWAPAEPLFLRKVLARRSASDPLHEQLGRVEWLDVCRVFTDSRLAVRGCFDYKLKSVAKALHAAGKLERTWEESDVMNGLDAMHAAKRHYASSQTRKRLRDGLSTVQHYNEMDTRVLHDIVVLLCAHVGAVLRSEPYIP